MVAVGLLAFDVASAAHEFALERGDQFERGQVKNSPAELRKFLQVRLAQGQLRLVLEATGVYYLDAALIACELGIEVMVLNPKAGHNFAKVLLQRSKTDRLDAQVLLEYLKRMPFLQWQAPSRKMLELREFGRYLSRLTEDQTASKNRLHALESSEVAPVALRRDLKRAIKDMEGRIARVAAEAMKLVGADATLLTAFESLDSIIGVGPATAMMMLGEFVVMPRQLNSRACVSHAGLDVRLHESGSSVHKPGRISKHGNKYLRRLLYMPALSAIIHDPYARAFRDRLIAKGKKKIQALVAVMRKMLTAAWALYRHAGSYDGAKLYRTLPEG
jgi:transposase